MMLGTVGEPERMQSGFLSDAVNLTARLEGLTKTYGVSTVISHEALNRLEDPTRYKLRFLGKVLVKGRQEPVSVFEVFDGDPIDVIAIKLQTKADFEQGLGLFYDNKFAEASVHFNNVHQQNPKDKAVKHYLERSAHHMIHGVPDDWVGVEAKTEK